MWIVFMDSIKRNLTTSAGKTITLETAPLVGNGSGRTMLRLPSRQEREAAATALAALADGAPDEALTVLQPFAVEPRLADVLALRLRAHLALGQLVEADQLLAAQELRFAHEPVVWKAAAGLRGLQKRPLDELAYRRKLVLLVARPSAGAFVAYAQAFQTAYAGHAEPPFEDLRLVSKTLFGISDPRNDLAVEQGRFLQLVFQFKPMQLEAINRMAGLVPRQAYERDVSAAWLPLHEWCERAELPYRRDLGHGRPGARPMLAELMRVAVVPSLGWAPLLDEEKVVIDGFLPARRLQTRPESPASPVLLHCPRHRIEVRIPKELRLFSQPALLIGGSTKYHVQTIDVLGCLAVAELLGAPPDLPLVVNADLAPFQREQFKLLGIDEKRLLLIEPDDAVRFDRLWVPTRLSGPDGWIDPLLPAWLRQRMLSGTQGQPERRLYVSHPGSVENEAEVIDRLSQHGFEVIEASSTPLADQLSSFADAAWVVGSMGPAIINMLYSPKGARVSVLHPDNVVAKSSPLRVQEIALACGQSARMDWLHSGRGQGFGRPMGCVNAC